MLEDFYGWVKTIAAGLIFMSLILRLLPEGKNVKYIRYFMGMVLVLVVFAPVGKLLRLEETFSRLELSFERTGAREGFKDELMLAGDVYAGEVVREYEEELAAQVLKFLEKEGYGDCSIQVTIDADPDSKSFGQVKQLEVLPSRKGEESGTGRIAIEKKKVKILAEEPSERSYLEEAEEAELKKLLSGEFAVPEGAVWVIR